MNPAFYRKIVVTLTLTVMLLSLASPAYPQEAVEGRYKLIHSVKVTDHGFLAVEETVEVANTGDASLTLQPFDINYASIKIDDLSSVTVQGPVDFDVEKSEADNSTKLTLRPRSDHQIPSGASATVKIQFYVSHLVDTADGSLFSAKLPLVPSMGGVIGEVQSSVELPADSEVVEPPSGFFLEDVVGVTKLGGAFQEVEPGESVTEVVEYILDPVTSLSPLEIPSVDRSFTVSADGSVTVRDVIRVVNRGESKATMIKLTLLNNESLIVNMIPIGSPPLVNKRMVILVDGMLDLVGAYEISLSGGEEFLFGIEYPLSAEYSGSDDGSISSSGDGPVSFDVPVKPPIDGVVGRFAIKIDRTSELDVSGGEDVVYEDVSPFDAGLYSFSASLRVAWASERVMPVATLLFLVVLVALVFGKTKLGRSEDGEKDVPNVEELVLIFEEKMGVIDEVVQSLRSRRKGGASKSGLSEARRYFESLKGKSAGKMGEARSRIISAKPHLKDNLSELANADKEYNRAVLDIIKLYEQHQAGKIRSETFERLRRNYQKRLDKTRESLSETIEYLHREVEK